MIIDIDDIVSRRLKLRHKGHIYELKGLGTSGLHNDESNIINIELTFMKKRIFKSNNTKLKECYNCGNVDNSNLDYCNRCNLQYNLNNT